jgi:hypothetical protein
MTPLDTDRSTCIACRQTAVRQLADFGPQPVGHHFLESPEAQAGFHPMVLGQCDSCGLAQLIQPIPPEKLVPRVDWIRYNEPEAHLDQLVDSLAGLPGLSPTSRLLGITYKEDTSLRRFQERGFHNTSRLDMVEDLGITNLCAGVEYVQQRLTPELVPHLRQRHGTPDLILVRHVIEHTHDTAAFLETFRQWVAPNGYVVFELPDCARGFDRLDYTTFWEDHSLYFVEGTFRSTLEHHGLCVVDFQRYPGRYEHCLIAITQPAETPLPLPPGEGRGEGRSLSSSHPGTVSVAAGVPPAVEPGVSPGGISAGSMSVDRSEREATLPSVPACVPTGGLAPTALSAELARVQAFATGFPERRDAIRSQLKDWRSAGPIGLFGAGHQASTFLNLLQVADLIDFVIDDHPQKAGRFMPGCGLPILSSTDALKRGAKVWLSTVGAESERKIVERNRAFVDGGGIFASIYPTQPGQLFTPLP